MQEGVPVIATKVGEIPNMIVGPDGATAGGLIDETRDSKVYFQTVCDATLKMIDPAQRRRAAQTARDLRANLDINVMVDRYLDVYEKAKLQKATTAPSPLF